MNDAHSHPPSSSSTEPATATFQQIPIRLIVPSPHQARKHFDEENLWKLAESLRQEGLIQPITVRRLLPTAGDREEPGYELVSGERRLRAAKLLNWESIEARVISVISEGEVAAKGLIENLQRENLNPIEEAEGFLQLNTVDPTYWTHERIGQVTGKSRVYITQSMSMLRLPEAIREDVRRRTYSRGHALEIARLPGSTLQLSVSKMIRDRLTREQTRKLVDSILTGKKNLKLNKPGAVSTSSYQELLNDPLGDLWPEFTSNPWITAPGTIKVKYLGNHKWSFELPGPDTSQDDDLSSYETKIALKAWLSKLFTRMGRSLSSEPGASPVSPKPLPPTPKK